MKRCFLIPVLILACQYVSAQAKFDLGVNVSPSYTGFYTEGKTYMYESMGTTNYGLSTSWRWKRLTLSSGLLHLTQGSNIQISISDPGNPESSRNVTSYIRIKSVSIPLIADYNIVAKSSFDVFAGLGLYVCNVYYEKIEQPWIKNYLANQNVINNSPLQRYTDLNYFDDPIAQANIGIGIRKKIQKQVKPGSAAKFIIPIAERRPNYIALDDPFIQLLTRSRCVLDFWGW